MGRRRNPKAAVGSRILAALVVLFAASAARAAERYPDRFVWVFGWGLGRDADVPEVTRVLETAADHGLTGAVASFGLDTLSLKDDAYFQRLRKVRAVCDQRHLELIPSIFSVGYGGEALAHDRNLAEGLLVEGAPMVVQGGEARLEPDASVRIENGGFEESSGNRVRGYAFHDQPGEVSFVDTEVFRSGGASLRFERFAANPHGHGRVMQEVKVRPRRSYRVRIWVKTEGLEPAGSFRLQVLAGDRALAPREFEVPSTTPDFRRSSLIFNSLDRDSVRLYAGVWGARSGRFWLDDWSIEEVGPTNVLRRPGTPVTVRSEDGATLYAEGADYAPLVDPHLRPWDSEHEAPPLKVLPGGRIREGQRLRVSWYHALAIHSSQVTVCMAEPKLYQIYDREAAALAERVHPRRVLLSMDEIRMGGTCAACRGRNMAELLGECVAKEVAILRRHMPGVEVYIWSDMFDPNHNAHANYYLVEGDFTGSWKHVPRDIVMAVWGGAPREASLKFFAEEGFRTLVACYYDAPNLDEVKGWLEIARRTQGVRGFMYTPWRKSYALLGAFGDLLRAED